MKRFLITTLFLLTATLLFCQESYPKKLVIENDTIIAITPEQTKAINFVFDERDFYKDKSDSLSVKIAVQSLSLNRQIMINRELSNENELTLMNLDTYKKLNEINQSTIQYKNKELVQQKNKTLKFAIGGLTVGVTTGALLVLILNK